MQLYIQYQLHYSDYLLLRVIDKLFSVFRDFCQWAPKIQPVLNGRASLLGLPDATLTSRYKRKARILIAYLRRYQGYIRNSYSRVYSYKVSYRSRTRRGETFTTCDDNGELCKQPTKKPLPHKENNHHNGAGARFDPGRINTTWYEILA